MNLKRHLIPLFTVTCLVASAASAQARPATPVSPRGTGSAVAVPEPITASLVGLAAAGVGYGLFGKRRRQRRARENEQAH